MRHQYLEMTGYYEVIEKLKDCALSASAKEAIDNMEPLLSEISLKKELKDTSEARHMLEFAGTPPLPRMEHMSEYVEKALRSELLFPEQLEEVGLFLNAVHRLKCYLKSGEKQQIGISFYNENLVLPEELKTEIARCIRGGRVDDYASPWLSDLKKQIHALDEKIRDKAERALRTHKDIVSEAFVVTRNGKLCIPVRREKRSMVDGSVVDQSATGATLFIETKGIAALREELEFYHTEADNEERRILYVLMSMIADYASALQEDIRVIEKLDFMFAKGKLSLDMKAAEPYINNGHYLSLTQARHPMLTAKSCIPLDIELGKNYRGIVITGPNTGGKTVAIKTAALMSAMACSGLHVPCKEASICMHNEILCDIEDGQNMSDNLSTFSAHIKNVLKILKRAGKDSLIIMDELGSGTDPAEGMGIAISILEELRKSGALFLVTTHYPEVKDYAARCDDICNARMAFDRESLKPLYQLRVGEAGESCALYIAKQLGFPGEMLKAAATAAYGDMDTNIIEHLNVEQCRKKLDKESTPKLVRTKITPGSKTVPIPFVTGDSVTVLPDEKLGIVVKPADEKGNVLVQIQKKKVFISHKRLKLKVSAAELYPADYDFSIIFNTVEERKTRHQMSKHHQEGLVLETEEF